MNTFPFPLLIRFTLSSFSSALPKTTTSPLFLSPKSASSSLATLFACADAMTASSVDARRTTQSMMPPTRNPATSFAGGRANDDDTTKVVVKVSPLPPLLLPRPIRCTKPSSRGRIGGRLLLVVVVLPIIIFAPRLDDTTLDACGSSSSGAMRTRGDAMCASQKRVSKAFCAGGKGGPPFFFRYFF